MKQKLFIYLIVMLLFLGVVRAQLDIIQTGNLQPNLQSHLSISSVKTEIIIHEYKCNGCAYNERCHNIGSRIVINPKYPNQKLAWINITYKYCDENNSAFVLQKVTNEFCENDFECQSNKCVDRKCEQKNRIKITGIFKDKNVLIENIFFQEKEMFYFKGLNKNYSIGFERNESDFIFLINNNSYNLENKTFKLNNNSEVILKSIFFDNGIAYANVTFIESKDFLNNTKELLERLNCEGLFINNICRKEGESFEREDKKYHIENLSLVEVLEIENISVSMTGAVIESKEVIRGEGIIKKLLNWFGGFFD